MSTKTYTVHRSMVGTDGREYGRGDEREMTDVEAAELLANGAIAVKGEAPVSRKTSAVEHTFGKASAEKLAVVATPREPSIKVDDKRPATRARTAA